MVRRQSQSSPLNGGRSRRPPRPKRSSLGRRVLLLLAVIVGAGVVLGLVFAGSPTKIAEGVRIDGVDVGGLEATDARALLERRSAALAAKPVVFVAAGKRFRISPTTLGVQPDWKSAVDAAQRQGDGFGPLRGFRRIDVDFFGADVTPPTRVLDGALTYELNQIAKAVDRRSRSAALALHKTSVVVVPARAGRVLDRTAAARHDRDGARVGDPAGRARSSCRCVSSRRGSAPPPSRGPRGRRASSSPDPSPSSSGRSGGSSSRSGSRSCSPSRPAARPRCGSAARRRTHGSCGSATEQSRRRATPPSP